MSPDQVKTRLEQAYPGGSVEVQDLTGTQDHYQVFVQSQKFTEMSRIERHKSVMAVFEEELKTGEVHALTIKTDIPKN